LLHSSIPSLLLVLALAVSAREVALAAPRETPEKIPDQFSGEKALQHVQHLVDFGPRPPASDAIEKARDYIENQLKLSGWQVTRQAFTDQTPRGEVRFVNLIARFSRSNAGTEPMFLLCSHYDTKTFATFRFVGANDSGSSTGLLLELARVLGQHSDLAAKVELVFFDGEEAYVDFSEADGLYGSRYFAKQLLESKTAKQIRGGILFDMVGDRSLDITLPPDSPPQMAHDIFASASTLKVRPYFTFFDRSILDDHTPLNRIGIPTIDIIDFDYPPWHTAEDTIDKLSARSLQIVGSVAAYYLAEFALK
jgi:glutaminyl-peptide cyclotransferase